MKELPAPDVASPEARFRIPLWGRVFIGVLVVVLALSLGLWLEMRRSLPKTSGTVRLAGLAGQVEVVRDSYGVPHIFAATDEDAVFALGYVHAQDRMWQLELQRRIGAGRLSEVLGEAALPTDKFLRTLGPYRAAEAALPNLSPESRALLDAYAAGINAWLEQGHRLPLEFTILGFEPESWTVTDSLVWSKMMAWDLGGNYTLELLRGKLVQTLGPERAAELIPAFPGDGTTVLAANSLDPATLDALLSLDTSLQQNFHLGGVNVGSNNWVIHGEHTETGLPLLANDPHLGARIPSIWYLAEIQGDRLHVAGATMVGLPLVLIGHNEDIAWGVTNLGPDVQDLYMERVNPESLNQVQYNGIWEDMTIVEEVIRIKDETEPVFWAARSTRHGPLISDVNGSPQTALSLRWTALDPDDTTMDAFLRVNLARNWTEFTAAMEYYVAPSQNFVYADREGNIGYFGPGRIPIRNRGEGMVPVPGWRSTYEWEGYIPFDALPQAFNPPEGYIVTANNRVVADEYPYFITEDWAEPYRAERITQMIEAGLAVDEAFSVAAMQAMQGDQLSTQTEELLPLLLRVEPADERQAAAMVYLREWDSVHAVDAVAPAIYNAWVRELGPVIFDDDLKGELYTELVNRKHPVFLAAIMAEPRNVWCDDIHTTTLETCADQAREALDVALDDLEARLGRDMSNWTWGRLHITQYPHNPFSEVPALRRFFHREIPNGGNADTVNAAPTRYEEAYLQYNVPSYRQVIDVSDWNQSWYMHTTGQSGNVLSPHYDDLIGPHQAMEYLPMHFGREAVSGRVLILRPR